MSKKKKEAPPPGGGLPTDDAAASLCLRLGWTMIAVFLAMGLVLESFHLVKLPQYLDVRLRRELWTLAHAHGTLLGAINVLFALSARRMIADAGRRLRAARLVSLGSVLVPAGFLLGGLVPAEGDPSPAIVLVPAGALLALLGLAAMILSRRS